MRAAVLSSPRQITVQDVADPAVGPGQVVVHVEASSICGTDLTGYLGVSARMRLPTTPGHEIAGTVVEVGRDGPQHLIGSRVVVEPNVSCRACEWCLAGLPNVCTTYRVLGESGDVPGGLAEFIAVAADQVYELPDFITAAEGAIVQPLSVSYHGVVDRGAVKPDETVLIIGAGPIGLSALMVAHDIGARTLVSDVVADRLAIAASLGAALVIDANQDAVPDVVREATHGRGADVTIEAVGGTQERSLADAVAATATRGRIVMLGTFTKAPTPFPAYAFKNGEQAILGSHGHPSTFAPTLALVAERRLNPRDLITHSLPLEDVDRAFGLLQHRADGVLKVVIEP